MSRRGVLIALAAAAIGPGLLTRRLFAEQAPPAAGSEIAFELVDTKGNTVRGTDLRGRWLLVFFGYLSCPDLCPTTMSEIAGALAQLGSLAARVQPIFVSIDPQRDRPEALRDYVRGFDERILPLSGTAEQLARAATSFGVVFYKVPGSGPDDYTFAHSAQMSLIGPEGGLVARYSSDANSDLLAATLRKLVDGSNS